MSSFFSTKPKSSQTSSNPPSKPDESTPESSTSVSVSTLLENLKKKYPNEPIFFQAVEELSLSLSSIFKDPKKGKYYQNAFRLMLDPERIISFRVLWVDDNNTVQVNTGYRVEFSSAIGPYKGGLRFSPTVNIDILKALAFEQMFKNALTGLPLGGGKGGSDFDPKGKSQGEVMRFCCSFMTELHRYLGESTDVPAGDIGVGGRELGYMYGQYKRLTNKHVGVLTGKPLSVGGSNTRPEATGYGLVFISQIAIRDKWNKEMKKAKCALSGSGNVSQYAADMLLKIGAKVVTMSDSNGVLVFPNGMTRNDWQKVVKAKQVDRVRLSQIEGKVSGNYIAGASPWTQEAKDCQTYDYIFPCATQNEIDKYAIKTLLQKRNVKGIFEGANLPITLEGQSFIRECQNGRSRSQDIIYIPGKASNAGGVGCSGFEMSQNAQKVVWEPKMVEAELLKLMESIYQQIKSGGGGSTSKAQSLEVGANQAGFLKVAKAMEDLGWLGE